MMFTKKQKMGQMMTSNQKKTCVTIAIIIEAIENANGNALSCAEIANATGKPESSIRCELAKMNYCDSVKIIQELRGSKKCYRAATNDEIYTANSLLAQRRERMLSGVYEVPKYMIDRNAEAAAKRKIYPSIG